MSINYSFYFGLVLILFTAFACSDNEDEYTPAPEPVSPVIFDLASVPYQNLSEYNFFEGDIANLEPVYGVLPYKIISTLFIDYGKAKTFVWMPDGVSAKYVDDYSLFEFPVGAVLMTNHYFDNVLPYQTTKILETRLLIKKEEEWVLANYKWNEEQTEATYTEEGFDVSLEWLENNEPRSVNYRIPSYPECFTCHNKYSIVTPIGPKPQNFDRNVHYDEGEKNQLEKWLEFGYLESYPSSINKLVDWSDETQPLDLRARSYLDINCSHCHTEHGYCEYRPMRFSFKDTADPVNAGICVEPDDDIGNGTVYIVSPGRPEKSVMHFRMSSVLTEYRMPLLGRTLRHEEGIELIEDWINSLTTICN